MSKETKSGTYQFYSNPVIGEKGFLYKCNWWGNQIVRTSPVISIDVERGFLLLLNGSIETTDAICMDSFWHLLSIDKDTNGMNKVIIQYGIYLDAVDKQDSDFLDIKTEYKCCMKSPY